MVSPADRAAIEREVPATQYRSEDLSRPGAGARLRELAKVTGPHSRITLRLLGSKTAVSSTTGNETTRAAAAEERAAAQATASSPLVEEVGPSNPVREAMEHAEAERQAGGLGHPGTPLNARSPFMIGMKAAAGVAVTYALVELFLKARGVLVLIGLAFFIAAGLDPVVVWLTRHGLRRWMAVVIVLLALLAFVGGFIAAAIPPVTAQISALINELPHYVHELQDHSSTLGKLNDKYHIETRITSLLNSKGSDLVGGVIGVGQVAISALSSMLLVAVMTIYFLVGMPSTKMFLYRLVPHSRRPRTILIGDAIFTKVGGYVLGNVITSFIAGGSGRSCGCWPGESPTRRCSACSSSCST